MQSLNGYRVGQYQVHEKLGEGRFAVVYRAKSIPDGKPVCIKLLRDEFLHDSLGRRTLDVEAHALHELRRNPHVMKLLDRGTIPYRDATLPYLVLEPAAGRDLVEIIDERGPFSEAEGLRICLQASQTLAAAHRRGIAHHDVKPEHFFWDGRKVTVIDWNVAQLARHKPEEFSRQCRIDLLEFGTVMYTIFTGWDARSLPEEPYDRISTVMGRRGGEWEWNLGLEMGLQPIERMGHIFVVTREGITFPPYFGKASVKTPIRQIITRSLCSFDEARLRELKSKSEVKIPEYLMQLFASMDELHLILKRRTYPLGLRGQLLSAFTGWQIALHRFIHRFTLPKLNTKEETKRVRAAISKGISAMNAGDYRDAVGFFQEALQLDPRNEKAKRLLAQCQPKARQPITAEMMLPNKEVRALISKGTSALHAEDYADAAEFFQQALQLDPQNEKARRLLAQAPQALVQELGIPAQLAAYYDPATKGWLPEGRQIATMYQTPFMLEIVQGHNPGVWYPLQAETQIAIGRSRDNDIILPDMRVSRHHAALVCHAWGCHIADAGSSNGTRLNGQPLQGWQDMRAGDYVQVGRTVLRLIALEGR